jgi:hypothetical protein
MLFINLTSLLFIRELSLLPFLICLHSYPCLQTFFHLQTVVQLIAPMLNGTAGDNLVDTADDTQIVPS